MRRGVTARNAALAIAGAIAFLAASSAEAPFLAANDAAMNKMMAAMEIKPSGDVDKDFVAMMTPHHQGAIEMAQAELAYGHNDHLKRIAQEIIVTQQQEIAAMRLAAGERLPPSAPAPDQIPSVTPQPKPANSGLRMSLHSHE